MTIDHVLSTASTPTTTPTFFDPITNLSGWTHVSDDRLSLLTLHTLVTPAPIRRTTSNRHLSAISNPSLRAWLAPLFTKRSSPAKRHSVDVSLSTSQTRRHDSVLTLHHKQLDVELQRLLQVTFNPPDYLTETNRQRRAVEVLDEAVKTARQVADLLVTHEAELVDKRK